MCRGKAEANVERVEDNIEVEASAGKQASRQAGRQVSRQASKQAGRHADKQALRALQKYRRSFPPRQVV